MALFTAETAAIMGRKGAEARWKAEEQAAIEPLMPTELTTSELIARDIEREIRQTIADYADCDDPKGKAALAQALRNLRETWHMVTGQSKPGNAKPSARRAASYPTLDPRPIEPVAQPVPTTNGVPPAKPSA